MVKQLMAPRLADVQLVAIDSVDQLLLLAPQPSLPSYHRRESRNSARASPLAVIMEKEGLARPMIVGSFSREASRVSVRPRETTMTSVQGLIAVKFTRYCSITSCVWKNCIGVIQDVANR